MTDELLIPDILNHGNKCVHAELVPWIYMSSCVLIRCLS